MDLGEMKNTLMQLADDILSKTYVAQGIGSEYAQGAADVAIAMKKIAEGRFDEAWNTETVVIIKANDVEEKA